MKPSTSTSSNGLNLAAELNLASVGTSDWEATQKANETDQTVRSKLKKQHLIYENNVRMGKEKFDTIKGIKRGTRGQARSCIMDSIKKTYYHCFNNYRTYRRKQNASRYEPCTSALYE